MSKTYIKREEITTEVYKLCIEAFRRNKQKECSCYNKIYALLLNTPVEDVVPVVHGKWIDVDSKPHLAYECSACKAKWFGQVSSMNYCPICGAKMDG